MSGVLPGHALRREGQRHDIAGNVIHFWTDHPDYPPSVGHGLCSCGEVSPRLPSNAARKRWHREHKASVRTTPTPTPRESATSAADGGEEDR